MAKNPNRKLSLCDLKYTEVVNLLKKPPLSLSPNKLGDVVIEACVRIRQGNDPGEDLFNEVVILATTDDSSQASELSKQFLEDL